MAEYTEEEIFADESAYLKTATVLGIVGRKDLLLPLAHRKSYIEYVKAVDGNVNLDYWNTPEGQQEYAYWQSTSGQDALSSIEGPEQMLQSLTDLVTSYSDASTVKCLTNEYGSLRDFIETSSPTTQCGNTIRGVTPNNTLCWICGTKITGFPSAGTFRSLELTPECEHVFPIAQAICFSGLYESQLYKQIAEKEGQTAAEAYRVGVSYEYQWAHRICNQIKNDTHYIVYDGSTFSINDGLLQVFLKDLQTTNKYGGGALLMKYVRQELGLEPDAWLQKATNDMRTISKRLMDYANTSGLTAEQHAKVTLMSLRSYIAMSPKCGGAVEYIPEAVLITGGPSERTSVVSMSASVATAKHFISLVTEQVLGVIQLALNKTGREVSARDRGILSAMLPDIGLFIRQRLEDRFTYLELNATRLKIFYYLKRTHGADISGRKAWSDFQVSIAQVIPGMIYQIAASEGPEVAVAGGAVTNETLAAFLSSDFLKAEMASWVNDILVQIRASGVNYDAIISTDPNVDPFPQIDNPPWFQLPTNVQQVGGGTARFPKLFTLLADGGLRKRRSLYSNASATHDAHVRPSGDEGLRKRRGTRRAPRVRQSTRKSRRRGQRDDLDRV